MAQDNGTLMEKNSLYIRLYLMDKRCIHSFVTLKYCFLTKQKQQVILFVLLLQFCKHSIFVNLCIFLLQKECFLTVKKKIYTSIAGEGICDYPDIYELHILLS